MMSTPKPLHDTSADRSTKLMTLEMIGTQSIHPDYSNLHKLGKILLLGLVMQAKTLALKTD